MKKNASPIIIALTSLLIFMAPVAGYADASSSEDSNINSIYKHKTPDSIHEAATASTEIQKSDKKILIEESREMSSFFKLGIAINIIMILVFSWWFRKEWRRRK